jgi:hypothetical protein
VLKVGRAKRDHAKEATRNVTSGLHGSSSPPLFVERHTCLFLTSSGVLVAGALFSATFLQGVVPLRTQQNQKCRNPDQVHRICSLLGPNTKGRG